MGIHPKIDYLKQYKSLKHNLFNYWSLLFYNKYIYYFFNYFFKRGKKTFSIKMIYTLLFMIKKKIMISPIVVLQAALLNYRHILKLKILRYRRRKIYSYVLLSLNKQVKVSVRHLAEQFNKFNTSNSKHTFLERLLIFILNLFFRTPLIYGRFLQNSLNAHKLVQENQRFTKKKKGKRNQLKSKLKRKKLGTINKQKSFKKSNHNAIAYKKFQQPQLLKLLQKRRGRRKLRLKFKYKLKPRRRILFKKNKLNTHSRHLYKEYTLTLRYLYNDFSYNHDLHIFSDSHVNSLLKPTFQRLNTQRPIFFNKLFLYIILGKSYSLLENVYRNITFPFWQLYVLRSKSFMFNYNTKYVSSKNENDDSNFFVDLHLYLTKSKHTSVRNKYTSLDALDSSLKFNKENILNSSATYLYKLSRLVKKTNRVMRSSFLKHNNINNKRKKKNSKKKIRIVRHKHIRRSFRIFRKKYASLKNRILRSNIHFLKNCKFIHLNKLGRIHKIRRKHLRLSYIKYLRKHYYYLLRFRLLRTVWRLIRSVALRKILRNRKKRSIVSTRVINYVK